MQRGKNLVAKKAKEAHSKSHITNFAAYDHRGINVVSIN